MVTKIGMGQPNLSRFHLLLFGSQEDEDHHCRLGQAPPLVAALGWLDTNLRASRGKTILCGAWRSVDADDHKGKKPDTETCFQNPQKCSWLVIRSNQFGSKKSNSCASTPITNLPTNGIIFCVCLTLAISFLQSVMKRWQKKYNKIQLKEESQRSRDQWWILGWFKSSPIYRNVDRIDGESMEFDWNIFPKFTTLQLSEEVKRSLFRLDDTPGNFTRRIIFMSVFNDISWIERQWEGMPNANLFSIYARRFLPGRWSFIGPGSEKMWYSISAVSAQGIWTKLRRWWCLNLAKADIQFSVSRVHCPSSKAKAVENCRYTVQSIWIRLRLFFA